MPSDQHDQWLKRLSIAWRNNIPLVAPAKAVPLPKKAVYKKTFIYYHNVVERLAPTPQGYKDIAIQHGLLPVLPQHNPFVTTNGTKPTRKDAQFTDKCQLLVDVLSRRNTV